MSIISVEIIKIIDGRERCDTRCFVMRYSVANSDRSSVIANHLGLLVSQNRCRFLKMAEHNYFLNVYLDKILVLFTS